MHLYLLHIATNREFHALQHSISLCNRDRKRLLRGTNWVFNLNWLCFVFKASRHIIYLNNSKSYADYQPFFMTNKKRASCTRQVRQVILNPHGSNLGYLRKSKFQQNPVSNFRRLRRGYTSASCIHFKHRTLRHWKKRRFSCRPRYRLSWMRRYSFPQALPAGCATMPWNTLRPRTVTLNNPAFQFKCIATTSLATTYRGRTRGSNRPSSKQY